MSLANLSIKEALTRLEQKEIKSSELIADCFKRIKAVDGKVKAFLTLNEAGAQAAAVQIDEARAKGKQLGPLAGIPLAHKDLFCTRGLRTTAASKILQDFVPPYNATAVTKLQEAGE